MHFERTIDFAGVVQVKDTATARLLHVHRQMDVKKLSVVLPAQHAVKLFRLEVQGTCLN